MGRGRPGGGSSDCTSTIMASAVTAEERVFALAELWTIRRNATHISGTGVAVTGGTFVIRPNRAKLSAWSAEELDFG
ncbi:hypothetical protein MFM001_40010 [Mycobacterium sp. MFM001]|nr:hypothetical protein MFM001_40010 [Mycobacterium sp. MFM001]